MVLSQLATGRKPNRLVFISNGFTMITPMELNDFVHYLTRTKYKNILQHLMLEHCEEHNILYLKLIKIKKSQRQKGYGDAVIDDIVRFADSGNVQIKLTMSDTYGTDVKVLQEFYKKHGFTLIKNKEMIYHPTKPLQAMYV